MANETRFPIDFLGPFPEGTILSSVNQHHLCKLTEMQRLNSVYAKLVSSVSLNRDESRIVECWLVTQPRKGIDILENGRIRVNVPGGKKSATLFLWEYFNGSVPEDCEISHLCNRGSEGCIRPSHLFAETRQINRSRDNCCGYIRCCNKVFETVECKHIPRCKICKKAKEEPTHFDISHSMWFFFFLLRKKKQWPTAI